MANNRLDNADEIAGKQVLPPVPYTPIPADISKKFPTLDHWNRQNHAKLEEWRKKAVIAMGGRV